MPPHDRLDLARVLLARAVDDETLVRKVRSDTDVADAIVGFHAQQAAEKLIKALLVARGVTFMRSQLRGRGTTRSGPIRGPRPGRTAQSVDRKPDRGRARGAKS
jgi:hypothetical protein